MNGNILVIFREAFPSAGFYSQSSIYGDYNTAELESYLIVMDKEPSFHKQKVQLKQLRDKALRELLPRMVEDIMDTDEKNLEQYHYMLECHLANWINLQEVLVVDEKGREIADIPGAIIKEIWCLKND